MRGGPENAPARSGKLGGEVGRLSIKRPTRAMRLFRWWLHARATALLAIVILLCVWAFLSFLPAGIEVPAALTRAHSSHVNQATNRDWHLLNGSYLAVPLEEAEEVDKYPVNADPLTALLLLADSFGASVVWLLTNGRGQGAFRSSGLDRRRSFVTTLEDRPFLGVFRL